MSAFFAALRPSDPAYFLNRDAEDRDDFRLQLETLWRTYEPYCPDPDFLEKVGQHFASMTWQMTVACVLMKKGLQLERPTSGAPDICVRLGHRKLWIECVIATGGTGAN